MLLAAIKPSWAFPLVLDFWGWRMPIHQFTDLLAYSLGFRLWLWLKKRNPGPQIEAEARAWLFVGCIFGALLGAKVLAWAEAPQLYWLLRHSPAVWTGGKTIVGGLLGGWAGIALAKRAQGIGFSTGDLFVFPLVLGIAVGRVGCFLTGLQDQTYGVPTGLPWGIDFGDGIARHPTQVYEILFLLTLGAALGLLRRSIRTEGVLFRCFMMGYLGFRFLAEFLKPNITPFGGLSAIQWACLVSIPICWFSLMNLYSQPFLNPAKSKTDV